MLARSLSMVHLDYCSSGFTSADVRTVRMLQMAQNACARIICHVPRNGHVTEHRWRLSFLSPAIRISLQCLILLHGMVYHSWSPALLSTLNLVSGDAFRRGRSAGTSRYVLPCCVTEAGRVTFHFPTVRGWNALPDHILFERRAGAFKRKLSAYMVLNDK